MTSHITRIFVEAIRKYAAARGIDVEIRADGWLIIMQRGDRRHFAFGYDIGLNGATAHRIANDKAATAEVLRLAGIDCIPHQLFLNPKLGRHITLEGSRGAMLALLAKYPNGLVVKPNEGTSGRFVFRALNEAELEGAAAEIFSTHLSLAASPFVEISEEVRVILLDEAPLVTYSKQRVADWRHNLDFGARPILMEHGKARDACIAIAAKAARAISIRFASVDVVNVEGGWKVLEINSGVMMEVLGKHHPELVYAAYDAALDKVFG